MSHHTLLHQLVRPPVRLLAATRVTPNQLTTLRLATGLIAAAGFAWGVSPWPALGALSMLVSMLLDRADGELARATGRMSKSGYRYDLLADGVSTVAVFLGMGLGSRTIFGPLGALLGVVAAVSIVALFLLMQMVEATPQQPVRRPFDPDDALVATPFLVWMGWMPWTLLAAAVLSPLAALLVGFSLLSSRRASRTGR